MSTRGLGVSCCGHVVSVRWAVTCGEQESFWLVRGLFGDGLGTVCSERLLRMMLGFLGCAMARHPVRFFRSRCGRTLQLGVVRERSISSILSR